MKLSSVNAVAGVLAGIKINRITDKAVKIALVNDYLHLRRFVKDADEQRNELIRKFQDDWADELAPVDALRKVNKPVVGHDEYLDAEKDAQKAISDIFSREVDVSLKPVGVDAFLAACGGEELTLEQMAVLQECGIIE